MQNVFQDKIGEEVNHNQAYIRYQFVSTKKDIVDQKTEIGKITDFKN